jgi:hypothetical protein
MGVHPRDALALLVEAGADGANLKKLVSPEYFNVRVLQDGRSPGSLRGRVDGGVR